MGLRKLRGRLDQLQAKANWTMDDYRELARTIGELITEIANGVAVGLYLEEDALLRIGKQLVKGEPGLLPAKATIDVEYDTWPNKISAFTGGPFDGKNYKMTAAQQRNKTIVLAGESVGHTGVEFIYTWNGYEFAFDRELRDPDAMEEPTE